MMKKDLLFHTKVRIENLREEFKTARELKTSALKTNNEYECGYADAMKEMSLRFENYINKVCKYCGLKEIDFYE